MKKTTAVLTLLFAVSVTAPFLMARPAAAGPLAPSAASQEAAQKKQPEWKSREEYDAFEAFVKEKDPSKRASLIQAFLEKYSNSDFKGNALVAMMQTYVQLNDTAKAISAAHKALDADPDSLDALSYLSFTFPYTFKAGDGDAASQLSQAKQEAQHGLEVLQNFQKPAGVTDEQFEAYVKPKRAIFNTALGFVALQQKDYASAIAPLKAAIEDDPKNALVYSLLGQSYLYSKPPDFNDAIWDLGRSVSLAKAANSPNATQLEKFYDQVYEGRHGSNVGEQDVLGQAASSANPPDGFNVTPPPTHQPTGDKNIDAFYKLEDALIVGGDTAQANWGQLKGQPIGLVGTVDSVAPGPDAGTTLVNVDITPESKSKDGVYDIQLQDSSQADAKLLQTGDPVSFQGNLSAYSATPSFSLTVSDAKINEDVLKMASERAKAKEQEKKTPPRHRPHAHGRGGAR